MNQSPSYQRALKWAALLIAGILGVGAALDALSNAIALVTLPVAVYATVVIVPAWLLTELVAAFVGIPWNTQGNTPIRVRALGPRVRLGIVGALTILWLPQLNLFLPSEVNIPNLQVELRNKTTSELTISRRGEFVLWLPTALYDGAPRIGGKMNIAPLRQARDDSGDFKVAAGSAVRCSVTFLNPKRFARMLDGEETDGSLVVQTATGIRISPNFAFSRGVLGQKYLEWVIE
jgi:hypothetical protein